MTRKLGDFLQKSVDERALERQWTRIERRRARAEWGRRTSRVALVAAALAAIVVAVVTQTRARRELTTDGPVAMSAPSAVPVEPDLHPAPAAAPGHRTTVELAEGSRLHVAPGAIARVASSGREDVRVVLDGGKVDVEASHDPARRSFVVSSGAYEVRVVGTIFWVSREGEHLEVGVREGRVEVLRAGEVLGAVSAGETFSSDAVTPAAASLSAGGSVDGGSRASALVSAPSKSPSSEAPPPSPKTVARDEGEGLFESAQRARAEGRFAEAARLFDEVRRQRRGDRRAPLAAFELGRLRLDVLGDPGGAAEAFADALALGPGSALAEDASARLVEARGKSGDRARCAEARDAYLERYPRGVYARVVAAFCK